MMGRDRKPLKGRYAKLSEDIVAALAAGVAAELANPEDGGTCNFDSPALYLPRWKRSLVEQAAEEAGTRCRTWTSMGGGVYIISIQTSGQANARVRNMRAALKAFQDMGYDALGYYAID